MFECALALFSEHGFDRVSVRDIARAVGIKESSIYNHYESKQALLDEMCNRFVETLSISRPPLSEIDKMLQKTSPKEIMKALISAYGRQIDETVSQMARLVFSEQFHNDAARHIMMFDIMQNNASYYEEILTLMQQKGRLKPCDKHILANVFNNEQVMLCMMYANCKSEDEFLEVSQMMQSSAEYLFAPLEQL